MKDIREISNYKIATIIDKVDPENTHTILIGKEVSVESEFVQYQEKYPDDYTIDDGFLNYLEEKYPITKETYTEEVFI